MQKTIPTVTPYERKGDVWFFKDAKGKLFYRIKKGAVLPVKNGKMAYTTIDTKGGYTIRYERNGVHGFSIWKGGKCLEDNWWELKKAEMCRAEWLHKEQQQDSIPAIEKPAPDWYFNRRQDDFQVMIADQNRTDGRTLCIVTADDSKATAELICLAVNNYSKLIDALHKAEATITTLATKQNFNSERWKSEHLKPITNLLNSQSNNF